jgi:hypothetical protein
VPSASNENSPSPSYTAAATESQIIIRRVGDDRIVTIDRESDDYKLVLDSLKWDGEDGVQFALGVRWQLVGHLS